MKSRAWTRSGHEVFNRLPHLLLRHFKTFTGHADNNISRDRNLSFMPQPDLWSLGAYSLSRPTGGRGLVRQRRLRLKYVICAQQRHAGSWSWEPGTVQTNSYRVLSLACCCQLPDPQIMEANESPVYDTRGVSRAYCSEVGRVDSSSLKEPRYR